MQTVAWLVELVKKVYLMVAAKLEEYLQRHQKIYGKTSAWKLFIYFTSDDIEMFYVVLVKSMYLGTCLMR